ncbi:MAG: HD domain-containing protein, partial [Planctomycetales bacterium]
MSSHQARHADSFEKSQFFKRLKELSDAAPDSTSLTNLCTATQRLLDSAEQISRQIVRYLPQFTLHDQTHLWNVLSFMEELAGGSERIQQLSAGDCAMAIWAAFIHDLGALISYWPSGEEKHWR